MADQIFRVYNTMTQKEEIFEPNVPGEASMYVCGVTAYALSHIGHARAAVSFDVLFRYLTELGYKVTYVRNFTDVDDKIIDEANKRGVNPLSLSDHFCQEYMKDMEVLQCLTPTHQPRVSTHIDQIIDMITKIMNEDYGYVVDGDVFFEVGRFPDYGKLSRQKMKHIRPGERVSVDVRKRNPADFALWKSAKTGEVSWDSPWGKGRPGWHIECSAMSAHYLTEKFDIHGGGIDLKFPHHENEIAQTAAACHEARVSYWVHNGHVTIDGEKMSKSTGNFKTIRDVIEKYHPLALRCFLLSTHYRNPLNYSDSQLEIASDAVYNMYNTLHECEDALSPFQDEMTKKEGAEQNGITQEDSISKKLEEEFGAKMSDDLNTANILTGASFQDALRFINTSLKPLKEHMKQQKLSLPLVQKIKDVIETMEAVKKVLSILGLLSSHTYSEVVQQLKTKALKRAKLSEDEVLRTIAQRTLVRALARKDKKYYEESDRIRVTMEEKGIQIEDVGNESFWRPCVPKKPRTKSTGERGRTQAIMAQK